MLLDGAQGDDDKVSSRPWLRPSPRLPVSRVCLATTQLFSVQVCVRARVNVCVLVRVLVRDAGVAVSASATATAPVAVSLCMSVSSRSEHDHDSDHLRYKRRRYPQQTRVVSSLHLESDPIVSCHSFSTWKALMRPHADDVPTMFSKMTSYADHTSAGSHKEECGVPSVNMRRYCYKFPFQIHPSTNNNLYLFTYCSIFY